jgi:oligopeptide/dipeptide ABC transporter ATP-binding protein
MSGSSYGTGGRSAHTGLANVPFLEVRNLSTHFRLKAGLLKAVDDVTFALHAGEMLGLVGESGCGKSMTALSIQRLVPPPGQIVSGEILLQGLDLMTLTERQMREIRGSKMAMIFQDPLSALNPAYDVAWQIREVYHLHNPAMSRHQTDELVIRMLETVGIPDAPRRRRDYPHQFSGGMRQRVLIAIALAAQPAMLLADEPTTALDVTIRADILDLIAELAEQFNLATILITHDLNLIVERCDRTMVMYAGQIVESGPSFPLYQQALHPYTEGLIDSIPRISEKDQTLKPIRGEVPDLVNLPPGCSFAPRCDYAQDLCRTEHPKLRNLTPQRQVRCHFPLGIET